MQVFDQLARLAWYRIGEQSHQDNGADSGMECLVDHCHDGRDNVRYVANSTDDLI